MIDTSSPDFARIRIQNLVKRYNYQAVLDRLCLTLEGGSLCVLVGANGVGKTTLLRILASLVRPDGGEIHFDGAFAVEGGQVRRQLGYLGHQSMFYQDLTAGENLRHYARLYQLENISAVVDEGIRTAGLEKAQNQPVRTYSRGMIQRLAISRALLHDPQILLLDEPYTGLDPEAADALDARLQAMRQPGRVILLTAHRPQRLRGIATHFAWLQNGGISQHVPVEALPAHPDLLAYLGALP
jgi:heme exporter protein A